MSDSLSQRAQLRAVRRTVLGLAQRTYEVARHWLQLSGELRHAGRFDSARVALKNAEHFGADAEDALLEDCRILKEQGHAQKALQLLEPSEIDVQAVLQQLKPRRKGAALPAFMDSEEKRRRLAERVHLATQIIVESQQSHGAAILERFDAVLALHRPYPQASLDCAKYCEFLFQDALEKEILPALRGATANGSSTNGFSAALRAAQPVVERVVEQYAQCLVAGPAKGDVAAEALPRLLTLWLSFTELGLAPGSVVPPTLATLLQGLQTRVNDAMHALAQQAGAHVWFPALQQLVSRASHRNTDTAAVLETLLVKALAAYPQQCVWHLANLMESTARDRRDFVKRVLKEAHRLLKEARPGEAKMLVDAQHLFRSLIALATAQTTQRRMSWTPEKRVQLDLFLVPTQAVLLHTQGATGAGFMRIRRFHETVEVAASKAKPKTLRLDTTCGRTLRFLCKQEKDGDLRKDVRLMEFNSAVNKIFARDAQARQRALRLRTYAVVCLSDECGVLEWVDHTECLRAVIQQAHAFWPATYAPLNIRDVYLTIKESHEQSEDDLPRLVQTYRDTVGWYKPCLHKWFLETFRDATRWVEARTRYTRSVAVWSAVGFVIGLGDRHTENILLDMTSGECVHVDFDCLFDKGLTLARPEIIPFRLTQNMVDAMGVAGVEGVFRRTLEVALQLLRENRDMLLSVLEPFLRDPTVAWSRSGRAQRSEQASGKAAQAAGGNHEQLNNEATEMLKKISARLSGVFHFMHPCRDKLLRGAKARNQPAPSRGVGPSREELLPLSVAGQAQRLIDEATAIENLAQLYYGWQAWL